MQALEEAKALAFKGEHEAAINRLFACLEPDFFNDEVLFYLGGCFLALGRTGPAAVFTSVASDVRKAKGRRASDCLLNLGLCHKIEHRNDMAETIFRRALEDETDPFARSRIYTNMAGLYINEGQPLRAIDYCDLALKEDPRNYGALGNRGLACLELGRWREGWVGHKAMLESGDRTRRDYPGVPEWDWSPGKTVIVWGDQGVGDEIFFAQCLGDMQKRCKRVILDCHPRLEALFKRSFPEIEVHGTRKHLTELTWLRDCDAEASVCLSDLMGHFRNEDAQFRGEPYLTAEPAKRDGLRIGLSWTGGGKKTRRDLRSLPIEGLIPILKARPDAQWFSLQYTPEAAREVCALEENTGFRISHFPGIAEATSDPDTEAMDRLAGFVGSLDLVITVCTTVHHLAGALGVPVWTLVPSRPGWKYQLKGDRLPWYGSARLFRQERDGDWSHPVQRVAQHLHSFERCS